MRQRFCTRCGAPLSPSGQFCPGCGAKTASGEDILRETPTSGEPASSGAFPRMLAYIPGLFWVPLAADSGDPDNRSCANQGLLLLLYDLMVPLLLSLLGAVLACAGLAFAAGTAPEPAAVYPYPSVSGPYPGFDQLGTYFSGFGAMFQSFGTAGRLLPLLCLPFFLYGPVNSIWGFLHCINHRHAHILPVIGKIRIIR